jgi:hypothetical protein
MRIELHIERVVVDSDLGPGIDRDALRAALVAELGHGLSAADLTGVTSTAEASRPGRMSLPPGASAHVVGAALGRTLTGNIVRGAHPAPATESPGGERR